MKLWQLKKLSTNESLNDPQPLPENWRNIFGLQGVIDKLGDLTWAGHPDTGWFEVDVVEPIKDVKAELDAHIQHLLDTTLPMVAFDKPGVTKAKLQEWVEYRKKLQEVYLQVEYPNEIYWPTRPE